MSDIYTVIDPSKDPTAVSTPPPPRKPKSGKAVKATTLGAIAESSMATASVGSGVMSPAAGGAGDQYDDDRMDDDPSVAAFAKAVGVALVDAPSLAASTVRTASPVKPATRVRFETEAGIYSVPALSVTPSDYGVMVMLPMDDSQASFVPAIGSKLRVGCDRDSWACYFPGTEFDLDQPKAKVLVFIIAQES